MTYSEKGEEAMLPEERKAIARLAHDAINQRNLADWLRALIVFEIVVAPAAVTSEAIR